MPQNGHGKRDNRMVFTCSGSEGILEGIWIRFTNCGFGSSAYLAGQKINNENDYNN